MLSIFQIIDGQTHTFYSETGKKVHDILSNIKIVSIFAPANQIYTF